MTDALLAIDDLGDDLDAVLRWAIEFKRLWKSGDEVVLNGRKWWSYNHMAIRGNSLDKRHK